MKLFEYVIYLDDIFGSIFQDYDDLFFQRQGQLFYGTQTSERGSV